MKKILILMTVFAGLLSADTFTATTGNSVKLEKGSHVIDNVICIENRGSSTMQYDRNPLSPTNVGHELRPHTDPHCFSTARTIYLSTPRRQDVMLNSERL